MCNTYHQYPDPYPDRVQIFRDALAILAPNGRVAIVEYDGRGWFDRMLGHFTPAETIEREMREAGTSRSRTTSSCRARASRCSVLTQDGRVSLPTRARAAAAALLLALSSGGCATWQRFVYEGLGREKWQKPDAVIEVLGIEPGDTVADFGEGLGPNGRIAIVEYDGHSWLARMLGPFTPAETIEREMREAGFERVAYYELPRQSFQIFRPKDGTGD